MTNTAVKEVATEQPADKRQLVTVEQYKSEVLPPDKAAAVFRSLPAHLRPEVFERNLAIALMQNPDLMGFHPSLVYREVTKAAALGLLLDPQLGEAYLVVAYNGKTKRKEPQLRIGYKGMCKLARQSGNVSTVYAREVCQNDRVDVNLGYPPELKITPADLFGDRGPPVGYVALISFKDNTFDFEAMSVAECRKIRDRSDGWKAYKEDKIRSTPWSTDESEMSKKTVLRRLMKRQELSPEMRQAIEIEDRAEFPDMGDRTLIDQPKTATRTLSAKLDALAETTSPPTADEQPQSAGVSPALADAADAQITADAPTPGVDTAPGAELLNLTELVADLKTKTSLAEVDQWHREDLVERSIEALSDADRRLFDREHETFTGSLAKPRK